MVIVLRKNQWQTTRKDKKRSLILAKALGIELASFSDDKPLWRKIGGGAGQFVAWADNRFSTDDENGNALENIADFITSFKTLSAKDNAELEINNRTLNESDVTPEFAAGFVAGVNAAGGTIYTAKDARTAIGRDERNRRAKRINWLLTESGLKNDLFFFDDVDSFRAEFEEVPTEVII
jgi:hypothetical protein